MEYITKLESVDEMGPTGSGMLSIPTKGQDGFIQPTLVNLNNAVTDKGTTHAYLDTYEELFSSKRDSADNLLEIGVCFGGSLKLWLDYFSKAKIHGIDIEYPIIKFPELLCNPRVVFHCPIDAYNKNAINHFGNSNFDIIIDDGSHVLEHLKYVVKFYSRLLSDKGILVIEDVMDESWIPILKSETPDDLKQYIEVYDLRYIKNQFNDILFVINKK